MVDAILLVVDGATMAVFPTGLEAIGTGVGTCVEIGTGTGVGTEAAEVTAVVVVTGADTGFGTCTLIVEGAATEIVDVLFGTAAEADVVVVIATGRGTLLVVTGAAVDEVTATCLWKVVGTVGLTACEAGFKGAAAVLTLLVAAVATTAVVVDGTATFEEAVGATGHGTFAVVVPAVKIGDGTFAVVVVVAVVTVLRLPLTVVLPVVVAALGGGKRLAGKVNFCPVGTAEIGLTAVIVALEAGLTAVVVSLLALLVLAAVTFGAIGFGVVVESVVVMLKIYKRS